MSGSKPPSPARLRAPLRRVLSSIATAIQTTLVIPPPGIIVVCFVLSFLMTPDSRREKTLRLFRSRIDYDTKHKLTACGIIFRKGTNQTKQDITVT